MTILYEKYRPKTLSEYIGNEKIVGECKKWLEDYYKPKPAKSSAKANIILMGPPGIGKTTLAHNLLNHYGFDVIELNASDTRNGDQVDNIFKETLKSANNVVAMLNNERQKIGIIMDEIDGLSTGDKGGMKRLQHYLARNNFFCPIILTSNLAYYTLNGSKKLMELKKNCDTYTLDNVPNFLIYKRLEWIVSQEGMEETIPSAFLNILIQNSGSDFRLILNTIELINMLAKMQTLELDTMLDFIKNNSKDINYDLFQATEKIYREKTTANEIFTLFDTERYNLPLSSYDSLYKYLNHFGSETLLIIQKILTSYVSSIPIENAIYNNMQFDLFDNQCVQTIFSIFCLFRELKKHGATGHSKFQNSRVISRMNCINANRDTRIKISKKNNIDQADYHLYIEYLVSSITRDPQLLKNRLDELDLTKEEMLRLLKSADCKNPLLSRLKDLGIITQRELEKAS